MLNVTVEGVYESDTGSGQKQFVSFSYDFKISKPIDKGIRTHVQRRFIPFLVYKDGKKANKVFSRLHSCVITNVEKAKDDKGSIIGKDIRQMNDWEIQDLACLFDLYEIPLPMTCSISELRDKATIAYMKQVLKIPMNTPKEIEQLGFIKINFDGSYKLELDKEVKAEIPPNYFEKVVKKDEKKDLSYFMNKIFNVQQKPEEDEGVNVGEYEGSEGEGNDGFPSEKDLLN